ncbi:MAG: trypsin-like peptidase domain-containing protein [Planctomycetes bacterium]|nr:trypsin-like peptidase domain-containing protein [Planctomycetota bacterium]
MKKIAFAMILLLGVGTATTLGIAQDAKETSPVKLVSAPPVPLHQDLERHRVAVARDTARCTVSVEIDYERAEAAAPAQPSFPGMGGPDLSDPFFRYDLGPFSGLVVGPNHILISDRCLGEFKTDGAGDAVQAITVTLPNGERWPARVVGRHQQIDLALLELDCVIDKTCPQLNVIKFPEGQVKLERGQQIVVVGRGQNPVGTLVNDGIVSALAREDGRAFQLDARIGNSTLGAPVVDNAGRLVGMVTLHNHETFGQASGVSYAAYIHEVRDAYGALKEGKFISRPERPFMGVAAEKKWPDKPGLEVGNVVTGSGAEKSGIRNGDVLLRINETDLNEVEDLMTLIGKCKIGDVLKVKLLRGEEELTVEVTLGKRP